MKFEVLNKVNARVGISQSEKLLQALLKGFKTHNRVKRALKDDSVVRVVFVGAREAKKLNRQFRAKHYVPDVLSFEAGAGGGLGDIVLCYPRVKADALKHGLSFSKQRDYLIIHGFLHLLGYDHQNLKDERRMMGIQDRLFERLSFKKRS